MNLEKKEIKKIIEDFYSYNNYEVFGDKDYVVEKMTKTQLDDLKNFIILVLDEENIEIKFEDLNFLTVEYLNQLNITVKSEIHHEIDFCEEIEESFYNDEADEIDYISLVFKEVA